MIFAHFENGKFPESTPEAQGIPSESITACLKAIEKSGMVMHGFHILKNGYLVGGGSAAPFSFNEPQRMFSSMKSVLLLALLMLNQEGKLDFDEPIIKFFPEYQGKNPDERINRLTVKHVMCMAAGRDMDCMVIHHYNMLGLQGVPERFRDKDFSQAYKYKGMSISEIFLSLPFDHEPGTTYFYENCIPDVLSDLVQHITGKNSLDYLKDNLLPILGINHFDVAILDGKPDLATITFTEADLCKFALFFLQRGNWEGKQIIKAELIDEATAFQVPTKPFASTEVGAMTLFPGDEFGYGYQIWRNSFGGYRMCGAGGQVAIILPEQNFIAEYTACDWHFGVGEKDIDALICEHVFKNMFNKPIAENPAAYAEMKEAFANWSSCSNQLEAHSANESKWEEEFELVCEGLAFNKVKFDFKNGIANFTGDKSVSLKFGVDGEFKENAVGLGHNADYYSHIPYADKTKVFASAGWKDDTFVLHLQYLGDMECRILNFKLIDKKVYLQ